MLVFIDTEFSDFINTELISIGLVSQDGQSFYVELPFNVKECSDFVKEAVIPLLGKVVGAQIPREELKPRLLEWLEQFKSEDQPTVVCFDYSGDWTLLCDALDNEVPSWIHGANVSGRYINELREEIFWRDNPELMRHHALNDARALKASFVLDRWLNSPK